MRVTLAHFMDLDVQVSEMATYLADAEEAALEAERTGADHLDRRVHRVSAC